MCEGIQFEGIVANLLTELCAVFVDPITEMNGEIFGRETIIATDGVDHGFEREDFVRLAGRSFSSWHEDGVWKLGGFWQIVWQRISVEFSGFR